MKQKHRRTVEELISVGNTPASSSSSLNNDNEDQQQERQAIKKDWERGQHYFSVKMNDGSICDLLETPRSVEVSCFLLFVFLLYLCFPSFLTCASLSLCVCVCVISLFSLAVFPIFSFSSKLLVVIHGLKDTTLLWRKPSHNAIEYSGTIKLLLCS